MPTGYTAGVVDGTITELTPFAMQLARGMGALVSMRDDPWDAPVPEKFEPSSYNADKHAEALARRDALYAMTDAEADAAAEAEYQSDLASKAKYLASKAEQRERYAAMIAKVEAWQGAPEGIKEFALEQLRSGMTFDCGKVSYWKEPTLLTGAEWRKCQLEEVAKDILYHSAEDAKERARTEGRNAWLAQLRKSLGMDANA